jgi:hypothetical protein
MCICYSIPIIYVYSNYCANNSVSNIICNKNITNVILYSMSMMAGFTLYYEFLRNNCISLGFIGSLFIGIYGVILIPEHNPVHYIFAFLCFFSILGFMIYYCCILHDYVLYSLTSLILWVSLWILVTFYENIFYGEISFLALFAAFYFYLHIL